MEEFVADATMIKFEIEDILEAQADAEDLLFCGMDKSNAAVCTTFDRTQKCDRGNWCPFRHIHNDRSVVCKHWLRGLCKKGDDCEFLHEYNMSKMPECYFFAKFGECGNKECPFLHIDPDKKLKDCQWYNRGFCRHGPSCKNRHARRLLCTNYLIGFCPQGSNCKYQHPTFDLPVNPDAKVVDIAAMIHALTGQEMPVDIQQAVQQQLTGGQHQAYGRGGGGVSSAGGGGQFQGSSGGATRTITCYHCHQPGHMINACPNRSPAQPSYNDADLGIGQYRHSDKRPYPSKNDNIHKSTRRPLDEVTCYKCNEKGHYANKCPKGMLAFLSNAKSADLYQQHPQLA